MIEVEQSTDYSLCPIPKTHRRLTEAHLLWHQTQQHYQEPEGFRANLNALIQALRNVTFILQSEKHSFEDFDGWYKRWQERLKSDPISRWVVDARNTIVKEGELETHSTALLRLVTWRDELLMQANVPPNMSASLIMRNLPLIEKINNAHVPPGDLRSASISIERRWVVSELEGRDILEALAQAYALLADVVSDAHFHLRQNAFIPSEPMHNDFPSPYDRTGILRCMALNIEKRTQRLDLSAGTELSASHSNRD